MLSKFSIVVVLAGLLITIAAVFLSFSTPLRYYPGQSPKQFETDIKAALPSGSNKNKVLAFLSDRRIEHSDYQSKERKIYAIQRNTCRMLFVECSIDMVFTFDEREIMRQLSVKEEFTGL